MILNMLKTLKNIFCKKSNNELFIEYDKLCKRSATLGANYVSYKEHKLTSDKINVVKNIALYLPQFHTIPENDLWWGKNFTEWSNVVKAVPQYLGQHQPQLPVDIGFYDLMEKKTWQQQIDMAKNYGIYGFCYYFYWFNGRRILEKPLDLFLADKSLNMPFCLFWANDSWVRTWHGFSDFEQGNRVLLEQNHNDEDDINVMTYLCENVFKDERYIKIGNKPLFIVYHIDLFKDIKQTVKIWREISLTCGFDGLYLLYVLMPGQENLDAHSIGFDAVMQFPPIACSKEKAGVNILNSNFTGEVYSYNSVVKSEQNRKFKYNNIFRGCFTSWDNEARRPTKGISYIGSSPDDFYDYLKSMNDWAKTHPCDNESIVFINAWNEWAEGAHLEPDREYGYAWLEQVSKVVDYNFLK